MSERHSILILLLAAAALIGCKVEEAGTDALRSRVPGRFATAPDTSELKLPDWRTVLFDPQLVKLTEEALRSSFDLREAIVQVDGARAGLALVRGIRLPDLNAIANAGITRYGEYTMDGVGNYDTRLSPNAQGNRLLPDPMPRYSLGLQTSWELDLWGKLKNRKKAALARFAASEEAALLVRTQVVAQVAEAYYALVAADRQLAVIEEFMLLQEGQLSAVRLLKEAGRTSQLAVETMEARLLGSKARRAEAIQAIRTREAGLSLMLGRMPGSVGRSSAALSLPDTGLPGSGIPSQLIAHRPDIRAAEKGVEAARADLRAARAAFYPTLAISASMGYEAFSAALLFSTPASIGWSVFGGLTAPLLNRRALRAELMANTAAQRGALLRYERTVTTAVTEVYSTLAMLRGAEDIYQWKQQEAQRLSEAVSIAMELFTTGRATYLDVVTAQEGHLEARLALIRAEQERAALRTVLYRALGGGAL